MTGLVAAVLAAVAAAIPLGAAFTGSLPLVLAVGTAGTATVAGRQIADRPVPQGAAVAGLVVVVAALVGLATAGWTAVLDPFGALTAALATGDVSRPPVPFTAGWRAVVPVVAATAGLAAGWVGALARRGAAPTLTVLPFVVAGAVAVPPGDQISVGVAVIVLLAAGLVAADIADRAPGLDPSALRRLARRALGRGLPAIAVLGVLTAGLGRADLLFPAPLLDPASEPQLPDVAPLDTTPDRVLFTVDGGFTGPYRTGVLDTYDPRDGTWRLAPLDDRDPRLVGRDGRIVDDVEPAFRAGIEIGGLHGVVLPTVPGTVGIVARRLPGALVTDRRSGTLRLDNGRLVSGLTYELAVTDLPNDTELRSAPSTIPADLREFAELAVAPPPTASEAVRAATDGVTSAWGRFLALRTRVLDTVTAAGPGVPVPLTAERTERLLSGAEPANPFELAALQVMLARWSGLPARIGFGFDCGDGGRCPKTPDGRLEVRPDAGAVFPEVWLSGYGWVPVTGTPARTVSARGGGGASAPTGGTTDGLVEELFLPAASPPGRSLPGWVAGAAVVIALVVLLAPLVRLGMRRWRRARRSAAERAAARAAGPAARIRLAYAEWRRTAASLGVGGVGEPPLAFLRRTAEDPEHTELAWLAVRAGHGDRRDDLDDRDAELAEALSGSLRRRLTAARPGPERIVALLANPAVPTSDGERSRAGAS